MVREVRTLYCSQLVRGSLSSTVALRGALRRAAPAAAWRRPEACGSVMLGGVRRHSAALGGSQRPRKCGGARLRAVALGGTPGPRRHSTAGTVALSVVQQYSMPALDFGERPAAHGCTRTGWPRLGACRRRYLDAQLGARCPWRLGARLGARWRRRLGARLRARLLDDRPFAQWHGWLESRMSARQFDAQLSAR